VHVERVAAQARRGRQDEESREDRQGFRAHRPHLSSAIQTSPSVAAPSRAPTPCVPRPTYFFGSAFAPSALAPPSAGTRSNLPFDTTKITHSDAGSHFVTCLAVCG